MYSIRHYVTSVGKDIYDQWIRKLRDRKARVAIDDRLDRVGNGNFGDHKFCQNGVWELRINVGPGYRIYYAIEDQKVILLLCGGDKRTQEADIERACQNWQDWKRRSPHER